MIEQPPLSVSPTEPRLGDAVFALADLGDLPVEPLVLTPATRDIHLRDLTVRVLRLEAQIVRLDQVLADIERRSLRGRWQQLVLWCRQLWVRIIRG